MKVTLEPGKGCCAVACQRARATSLRAEWLCHAQFRSGSGAECARSRKPVPLHLRAAQTTTLEVAVGGPARPAQDPQASTAFPEPTGSTTVEGTRSQPASVGRRLAGPRTTRQSAGVGCGLIRARPAPGSPAHSPAVKVAVRGPDSVGLRQGLRLQPRPLHHWGDGRVVEDRTPATHGAVLQDTAHALLPLEDTPSARSQQVGEPLPVGHLPDAVTHVLGGLAVLRGPREFRLRLVVKAHLPGTHSIGSRESSPRPTARQTRTWCWKSGTSQHLPSAPDGQGATPPRIPTGSVPCAAAPRKFAGRSSARSARLPQCSRSRRFSRFSGPRPRSRKEGRRALAPAELGESAGASRTTAVPVRSSGRRSSPDDRTTAQNVAVRRSSGQRTSVTRCSLRAPQLELYTWTCTLLIPPPQSTQWPLPYT